MTLEPIMPVEMEPGVPSRIMGGLELPPQIEGRSPWRLAWDRLRRDRAAMISLGVIVLMALIAIFAPVFASITGHGVNQQFRDTGLSPNGLPVAPNHTFWLGTDDLGRDVLVRIAYGARISLFVGVVATFLTVAVGTIFGLAAGYMRGVVDTVIGRMVDVVLSLPYLLFAIALASVYHASLTIVIIVIAFFGFASVASVSLLSACFFSYSAFAS